MMAMHIPVYVVFPVIGDVIVDNKGHLLYVNPTC